MLADFVQFLKDNFLFFIIIGVCVIAAIVVLVILLRAKKQGKDRQVEEKAEETPVAEEKTPEKTEEAPAEKEVVKEEAPEKTEEVKEEKKPEKVSVRYAGKWVITRIMETNEKGEEVESEYFFTLKASNGEALITSEEYTTEKALPPVSKRLRRTLPTTTSR